MVSLSLLVVSFSYRLPRFFFFFFSFLPWRTFSHLGIACSIVSNCLCRSIGSLIAHLIQAFHILNTKSLERDNKLDFRNCAILVNLVATFLEKVTILIYKRIYHIREVFCIKTAQKENTHTQACTHARTQVHKWTVLSTVKLRPGWWTPLMWSEALGAGRVEIEHRGNRSCFCLKIGFMPNSLSQARKKR